MTESVPNLQQAVYAELRDLAGARLRRERQDHTLQATALVHEVYLRLNAGRPEDFASRAEFFAAAAEAMRRVLIEHARRRGRKKRGGGLRRLSLSSLDLAREPDPDAVLSLDEALQDFARVDPRAEKVVRLRFFAGLSTVEIAEVMGVSERTARSDWAYARAWLFDHLADVEDGS